jgi:two-component system OmpR family response regulator
VLLAANAAEGLDRLDHSQVDAVLVDFVLPDMDGVTLMERIRSRGVRVPIVMLSGMATRRDQERALLAGADMYLEKDDMRRGALAETLRDLLETFAEVV